MKNTFIGILIGVLLGLVALLIGYYEFASQILDAILKGFLG